MLRSDHGAVLPQFCVKPCPGALQISHAVAASGTHTEYVQWIMNVEIYLTLQHEILELGLRRSRAVRTITGTLEDVRTSQI